MLKACALSLIGLALVGLFAPAATAQVSISWSVHNRFRLFDDSDAVVAKENRLLATLTQYPDLKTAYEHYYGFLQAVHNPTENDPNLFQNTNYNREPGDYSPRQDGAQPYAIPVEQTIDLHLDGMTDANALCDWYLDGAVIAPAVPCGPGQTVTATAKYPKGQFAFSGVASVYPAGAAPSDATLIATAPIQTSDMLIISMGDSYAAGEGSPDLPADVTKMQPAKPNANQFAFAWWRSTPTLFGRVRGALPEAASADWWSLECHRSLFSPHVIAALKIAASDPHKSVTYLSYACAGASVLDGLLTPQASPPGVEHIEGLAQEQGVDGIEGLAQTKSQLERAVSDLCAEGHFHSDDTYVFDPEQLKDWLKILYDRSRASDPPVPKCDQYERYPSVVFLTIGGNDIGFAGLAAWGITPTTLFPPFQLSSKDNDKWTRFLTRLAGDYVGNGLSIVCPTTPYPPGSTDLDSDPRCLDNDPDATNWHGATELIGELRYLMIAAKDFFRESGLIDHAVVVQEAYPAPMNDQNGQLCGLTGPTMEFTSVDQLQEPWLAYKGMIPDVFHLPDDQIYIRADAARAVAGLAFDETEGATSLYNTLKDAQEPPTWILAGAPDFSHDGICAGGQDNDFAKDFGFPRAYPHPAFPDGVWVHRREIPTTWEAYEPRARWLRTPNDSLLTEAVSLRDGEILDEALGGTIHPTAQGQAAVADELFEAAQPSVPPK